MPQNPKAIFDNVAKNNLRTPIISNKCNSLTEAQMMLKLGENVFQFIV
jgi:hypothetical protein